MAHSSASMTVDHSPDSSSSLLGGERSIGCSWCQPEPLFWPQFPHRYAATTAAARGLEDSTVRTLGRWKSLAYLDYIKIPREQLSTYSARLC